MLICSGQCHGFVAPRSKIVTTFVLRGAITGVKNRFQAPLQSVASPGKSLFPPSKSSKERRRKVGERALPRPRKKAEVSVKNANHTETRLVEETWALP